MMFDYSKLKLKIESEYGSASRFAQAMHMSPNAVSARLSGRTPWTSEYIYLAVCILGISRMDIPDYFFTVK